MSVGATSPTAHYDRVTLAWRYLLGDNLHYGYFTGADDDLTSATDRLTWRMAEAAQLAAGQRVLDVGCGIGGPARFLAQRYGCHVTGITPSQMCVTTARELTEQAGLSGQVQFDARDGMDNQFDDATYDRVWVLESSHLMEDRQALIAESARVLRPGGRLVLCDIVLKAELPLVQLLKHARQFKLLDQVFGRARMETLARYRDWAAAHGLEVDQLDDISRETYPTFARWRENAYANRTQVVALIGTEDWEHFVAACDVLADFWNHNLLGYGIMAARRR